MKIKSNDSEVRNSLAAASKAEDIQSLGLLNKAQLASELHVWADPAVGYYGAGFFVHLGESI